MSREDMVRWGIAAAIALGGWLVGVVTRRYVLAGLGRLVKRTRTNVDEWLLVALRPHVPWWFLLFGTLLGIRHGNPGAAIVSRADQLAFAAFLFSLTLAMSSFLARVVEQRARDLPGMVPATTLTQNAVRIIVISLGLLVVLGNLGVAIAPLLTALGVGSLAVALALQPTLSNLFAGLHITLSQRIRVGDFVELETGQKGEVVDIGWRSTEIRELPNNIIIVPNARLAEIIVKNYALPQPDQAALVQLGVAYGSDLAEVERVTIEVAREIQREVDGADHEFEPFIRYHTFGQSSIDFTVILRVMAFADRYLVAHEFVKRIHRRFSESGIEIPFPQRVVHLASTPGGPA